MFGKLRKKEKTELDKAIEVRISNLSITSGSPEDDEKSVENLKKLTEVKAELEKPKNPINPNTFIAGGFTLVTALVMLYYEKSDVITSKVMSILPKPKL
ncbi:hypothetical protein [Turicimonas muris]|uniref:hypothetical protein n=1 Tax=Turicimonas muris TaxID=1796652 RepID=UPI00262AF969|nr:hypothetical protein [Turicimonas muris]